jgi:DnaJ-domain-containing protein 1
MSLGRRLYNLARAELRAAIDKVGAGNDNVELDRLEAELRALDAEQARRGPAAPAGDPWAPQVGRWYANLELPLGAGPDEVRAAYRRMMRRFHPDLHHENPELAATAGELAQRLREAHDGLLEHLGGRRR